LALVLVANLHRIPGPRGQRWNRLGHAVVLVWAAANVAAGCYAAVNFANGDEFFEGNYESDTFSAVRANPALDEIPDGCEVLSNLPNALYPTVESRWSPRRTGLESNEPTADLGELVDDLSDSRSDGVCLVWIDEEPTYGHLYPLEELSDSLTLDPLGDSADVSVYRVTKP
ncbi:MAG: hypothetical protein ACK5O2_10655, partial [Microthrixaceae bacterium]